MAWTVIAVRAAGPSPSPASSWSAKVVAVDHSDAMLANLVGVALAGVGDEAPAPIYVEPVTPKYR